MYKRKEAFSTILEAENNIYLANAPTELLCKM